MLRPKKFQEKTPQEVLSFFDKTYNSKRQGTVAESACQCIHEGAVI